MVLLALWRPGNTLKQLQYQYQVPQHLVKVSNSPSPQKDQEVAQYDNDKIYNVVLVCVIIFFFALKWFLFTVKIISMSFQFIDHKWV
jgi:hypothetical protein